MNKSYQAFSDNLVKIIKLLSSLGFIVHPTKTILSTCQVMEYLGFVMNSVKMTLTLTQIKKYITLFYLFPEIY